MVPEVTPKKLWQSKTLWINFIMTLCAIFLPQAKEFIVANPQVVAVVFTVINMILRLVTKDAVQLIDDGAQKPGV